MEEYIVSARKYRPATFDSVVGQRALTTTLLNAIRTGKLAHAYLFCGPRGVGKTTCARIFAKTINCLSPSANGEACNECESCRAFEEQRSMNIHELDAASNNSVEDIRELIDQVRIPPQIGKYKVFIIDEVHMLSNQAFNAFLKTLEEPPSYVIFILATTEKHKILPTILSRCQVYDFARMTIQGTIEHLAYVAQKEGYTAEPEALNLIAQKADGGMRDALSIFDQMASFSNGQITYQQTLDSLNMLDSEYYFRLVDHFLNGEVEPCLLLLNEILRKGFDGGNFISGLASHLRDLLVSRDEQTLPLLEVSESQQLRYKEQAQKCKPKFLYNAIRLCNDCDQQYRQSRNKRLQVEICLIQCAQASDEDASAGRRPAKILKPIFKHAVAQVATGSAPAPVATQTTGVASSTPSHAPQTQAPAAPPTLNITSRLNSPNASGNTSGIKVKSASALGLSSLLHTKHEEEKKERIETQVVLNDGTLTNENLLKFWLSYANMLPREDTAIAQRMKNIQPQLTSANTFKITVSNVQIKEYMLEHERKIVSFISQSARVADIRMQIDVAEVESSEKTYSKPEIFRQMTEKNPVLKHLQDAFELGIA